MNKAFKNNRIRLKKYLNEVFKYWERLEDEKDGQVKSCKFSAFQRRMCLLMALIIMSFASIQVNAAMWPTDSSSLNVTAYPLDAESRSIPAYSDVGMTRKIGTVYGSDKCTILSGTGNAVLIKYPVKGGRTKTGYVAASVFSNADLNGGTHQEARAKSDFTAYAYKTGNQKLGTVFRDDSISIIYSDQGSGRSQIIYPTNSGYKMGWIDWMPEGSDNTADAGPASVQQGVYVIRSAMDNNMVLDVFDSGTDYGTNIQLYRNNNGRNQQFRIIPAGDNWYKICSVLDERMCVDVYGGTNQSGSNVCLWEYHNQLWRFVPCGDGTYLIESHLGLYLDVENGESRDQANIIAFNKNANANQRWKLDWVPEGSDNTSDSGPASVEQGVYVIQSAMDNNMVLDVFDSGTDYGTNIQLYRNNNGRNQQFSIIPVGDNWYKICSVLDERMCVDVYGGTNQPGSNVCLWEYHNQLWRFIPCGDGTYLIESHLGLYLDVENGESRDQANIIAFSKNANANQRWKLGAVSSNSGSSGSEETKIAKKLEDLGNGMYDDGNNTFSVNKVYRGLYSSEQCKGYAKRLFQICFGYSIGSTGNKSSGNNYKININSSKTALVGSLAGSNMSEGALRTLFSKAKPGDFVQLRRRHTGSHSMIFYSYDDNGATFYESNLDNKNTIKKNRYTWSQLYSNNAGISVYTAKDYWLH